MFTSEFQKRLVELQSRLPERDEASRKALLVSTVGARTARQNPWKSFSKIEGEDDFYSAMNAQIEISQSLSALHAYLVHLSRDIVGNTNDASWIVSEIVKIETRIAQQEAAPKEDAPHHTPPKDAQTPRDLMKRKKTANHSRAISEDKSMPDRAVETNVSAQRNHGINANSITVHGDLTIQVSNEPIIPTPIGGEHSHAPPKPGSAAAGFKATKGPKHGSKTPNSKTTNEDPIRECLKTVLDEDVELARRLCETLFGLNAPVDNGQTVDRLLGRSSTGSNEDEFPLLRLSDLLKKWRDHRVQVSARYCHRSLTVFKELLMIASFPDDDRQLIESAMLAAWDNLQKNTRVQVGARRRDLIEKLLAESLVRLTQRTGLESALLKLVEPDFRRNADESHLFCKLKVLSEPTLPPDKVRALDWYAKKCMEELGHDLDENTDWAEAFTYRLKRDANDSAVVAMFISSESEVAIKMLEDAFPQLLLVVIPDKDVKRYTQVYIELQDIEKIFKVVLCDSQT